MREIVEDHSVGTAAEVPATPPAEDSFDWRLSVVKHAGALRGSTSLVRQFAKSTLYGAALSSLRLGWYHSLLTPRITILLYHRVGNDVQNVLTLSPEQFDRQMRLLKRSFHVLTIDEVLACRSIPRSDKPLVCVTFDDGYLDNFTNGVPILLKHQIPAAFFVSTGMMGTSRAFPHDQQLGMLPASNMNWDHLRKMRDQGFTIGSHSVSHIDCAAEAEQVVRDELLQSRDDLRRELGLNDVIFAYPYGGQRHMTAQRLELVKQAGYVGCLSGYGGSNIASVDRFNVLRCGIDWQFSDRAFLFKCLGLW